jgi:hypothetical protein
MMPFIYFIKYEVVDKALKQPMTPIEHTQSKTNQTSNSTRTNDFYCYYSG